MTRANRREGQLRGFDDVDEKPFENATSNLNYHKNVDSAISIIC